VGDWIDAVRIVRAKRLLAATSTPIIDIAAAVGLEDQSYFARFFKRETGLTPTGFRKAMQG
jgi:AraC-like DNA-binding protein